MELILINNTKLKITLTEQDLEQYELDCTCANYDNTETRRAFWNILNEAKHRTGFDAASDRVFIQLYPSKAGGCEMYVTKVGLLSASDEQKPFKPNKLANIVATTNSLSFEFDSLKNMILACKLINIPSTHIESNAWIDEKGVCYLFITPNKHMDVSYIYGIMNEFGSTAKENIFYYIKEHGKTLCKNNAVKTLSVF